MWSLPLAHSLRPPRLPFQSSHAPPSVMSTGGRSQRLLDPHTHTSRQAALKPTQRSALARSRCSRTLLGLFSGSPISSWGPHHGGEWGRAQDSGGRMVPSLPSEAQPGQYVRVGPASETVLVPPTDHPAHGGQAKFKRHDGKRPCGGRNLCPGRNMAKSAVFSGPLSLSSVNREGWEKPSLMMPPRLTVK